MIKSLTETSTVIRIKGKKGEPWNVSCQRLSELLTDT